MYVRNYDDLLLALHATDIDDLKNNEKYYSDHLQPMKTEEFEIVNCNQGWIYDRSMFPNTVVMEVSNAALAE